MSEESNSTDDAVLTPTCLVGEEWFGQVVVVTASGTVDMLTAPQLDEAISVALSKRPAALVVNLTDVEFLASAGMSVLVAAHQQASPGTAFGVVAHGPVTGRPLKLVGIADIIDVYPTLDEALAQLGT